MTDNNSRTTARPNILIGERIQLVVFRIDTQRYALPLAAVERILRAVEVTPLPGAPAIALGAIDMQGCVLPVLDMRRRIGLAEQEIGPDDHFLIARTARRTVVLVIDEADSVIDHHQSTVIETGQIVPGLEQFRGVVQLDDGLVLIYDLEKFLSLDEARTLDEAMDRAE